LKICRADAAPVAKVFWFFFSKKNKEKKALLFEKRSKNFYLFEYDFAAAGWHSADYRAPAPPTEND
jgi:hypothetical protein